MNFQERTKQRGHQRTLRKILSAVRFRSVHLSLAGKTTLFGSIVALISLFLPWIQNTQNSQQWSAFTSLSGNIGYFLTPLLLILIFVTLSISHKEKIKLHSNITFKDYYIALVVGGVSTLISIVSISFISGLQTFFEHVIYGSGVILCLSASILILIGGYAMRKQYKQTHASTIINEAGEVEFLDTSSNTKLPF